MQQNVPEWLPGWLKEALLEPTMSVPTAGRAVFKAERQQAYSLARQGIMPTIRAVRRMEVPTAWVRRQLMIDDVPTQTGCTRDRDEAA